MRRDAYSAQAELSRLRNSPSYHDSTCLTRSVSAFYDDEPEPGCTCAPAKRDAREARIARLEKELSNAQ